MKIILTGGGTGGHFYPLIAIAEQINKIADKEKIIGLKLYFMSNSPYDKNSLFENGIAYVETIAGKRRIYTSFKNFIDLFRIGIGVIQAIFKLYKIFPDVVISKGGYASFPTLFAAKILGIPVIIHESDTLPGRVNLWSAKFAKRIAVSYKETANYFKNKQVANTGQPIRAEILKTASDGVFEYLKLDPTIPVILILGGSMGSQRINDAILDILPELIKRYQVIHQVGSKNIDDVNKRIEVILDNNKNKGRYFSFAFLNSLALKMAAGASTIIISRAGSIIFEIASWQKPSIIIPIPESISRDQTSNAFAYARTGSAIVIEENNITPHTFLNEIDKIINDKEKLKNMTKSASEFAKPDAAEKIAREAINIALSHEK